MIGTTRTDLRGFASGRQNRSLDVPTNRRQPISVATSTGFASLRRPVRRAPHRPALAIAAIKAVLEERAAAGPIDLPSNRARLRQQGRAPAAWRFDIADAEHDGPEATRKPVA
jgi:hypothetical protein